MLRPGSEVAGCMDAGNKSSEFERGWQAAILAAQHWHEGQAQQAIVLSRRTRFPKNLEREAEMHRRSAAMMPTLFPEDV